MRKRLQAAKRLTGAGTAVALASGILFTLSGTAAVPAQAASAPSAAAVKAPTAENKDWGAFENFRKAIGQSDPVLSAALDQGYVEALNDSASGAGYTLNVKGVIRDSRSLTLLYELSGDQASKAAAARFALQEGGRDLVKAQGLSNSVVIGGKVYGYASFRLAEADGMLGTFSLTAPIYGRTANPGYDPDSKLLTTLKLNVQTDPTKFSRHENKLDAGGTLTVNGQKLAVEEAYATPLRTYVTLKADEANTHDIFRLTGVQLKLGKNGVEQTSRPQLGVSYRDGARYIFEFPNQTLLTDPDSVVLHADGIEALNKNQTKLTFDVQKGVASASAIPDLKAKTEDVSKDVSKITFTYKVNPALYKDPQNSASLLVLGMTFVDASGQKHRTVEAPDGSGFGYSYTDEGSSEGAAIVYVKKGSYKQPLTFDISTYPNVIADAQELKLK
ncbi:hypothetical protein CDO73_22490 [Saccharibacillus sp. O23]|uniref:DUF4179 domain-containing protein n=1 Tax=Saccharibacillus sp. O23 TaxID=2009338 RepID=UPI000B4E4291|nr:DUF4179 domain-containing protein [Saccharibacillus sp. O23]OWR27392.1 hypothetical protein CDO73_22490 [Saccharibacillus sp. O23]